MSSSQDTSTTRIPIVDAFVSPPLPNWEQLKNVSEPTGPLPEDNDEPGCLGDPQGNPKVATSSASRDTTSSNTTSNQGGNGKDEQGDKGERGSDGRQGEVWKKCQNEDGEWK
jgi:hypothetical protein